LETAVKAKMLTFMLPTKKHLVVKFWTISNGLSSIYATKAN